MTTAAPTTLRDLAQLVGGETQGDATTVVTGAAPMYEVAERQITLVDQAERLNQLRLAEAAAVVVPTGVTCDFLPAIAVDDVHAAFIQIIGHFRPRPIERPPVISPQAYISPSARIGADVDIHAGATIGEYVKIGARCRILPGAHLLRGCVLGDDVTIGPAAVLYENTVVGERSIIHAGAVIGANGFGYRQEGGRHVPCAQLGNVVIETDVEIGAGVTIDRGAYGTTRIGEGTKIDNLVQIAHNCQIGRHNLICSQVGVAGSTSTGDYVVMGGQAGIRDHVHIGTGAMLSAMAGVSNDVPDGVAMMGIPATPERDQKLKQAALAKLPEMRKEFKILRRTVAEIQQRLGGSSSSKAA